MTVLVDSEKYGLDRGELVVAQVAATNSKGQGPFSGSNVIGALVEQLPATPSSAPRRGENTGQTKIEVHWDFL